MATQQFAQLNTSKSKMAWSFPKAKRVPDAKSEAANVTFYDIPEARSKRAAAFGYGTKYDFTKGKPKTPAPNAYISGGVFEDKKRGFSMGLGRDDTPISGGQFVGDKNVPGPGQYNVREIFKKNICYSFSSKASPDSMITSKHTPGPGTYVPVDALSLKGKYIVSTHKNSLACLFSPAKSSRFDAIKTTNEPGPGQYDTKLGLKPGGFYYISKYKSNLARSFGIGGNRSLAVDRSNVPGPGAYRIPSDFGYYEPPPKFKLSQSVSAKNLS